MHSETGVDTGTVDFLPLHVQASDGRAHALGTDSNHADVLREAVVDRVEVTQKEAVRQTQDGLGLHGLKDLLVVVGLQLTPIRSEQNLRPRTHSALRLENKCCQ